MTNNFLKRFPTAGLAAILFLLLTQSMTAYAKTRVAVARALEGTWTVQVTLVDCQSGDPLGSPFQSLLTFARGGALTETTSNPMFFPAERGPGHGVWSHSRANNFTAVSTAFITLDGALKKTQRISQNIQTSDDAQHFTSNATVGFFDPAGNALGSACAVAAGQRFH